MTRISKGTVSVANGGTTVTLWVGDGGVVLSEITAPAGSMVIIEGVANFIASRTSTTEFELVQPHSGVGGAGLACTISAMTATETSIGTLNARTATVLQELSVLDANGRGLFYNLIGVTGANDPGPGKLAFNNADPELVTELYFDVLDANDGGRDVAGIIDLWPAGTVLIVRSLETSAYAAFEMAAGSDAGGYRSVTVSYVDHDGTLANEPVAVEWRLAGADKNFDVQVADMAARAAYDSEATGFRVLVSNTGDGRAAIYSKLSATAGDWSDPAYVTGPGITIAVGSVTEVAHDASPIVTVNPVAGGYELDFSLPAGVVITGGPVTTLDPGTLATADLVPIAGGYRLDLGLPRGPTGDINGVTSFWHGRITVDADAAAARAGLGLVKQASTTDKTAGRLLTVGAFGLGGVVNISDANQIESSGQYILAAGAANNGPDGNYWVIDAYAEGPGGAAYHIARRMTGAGGLPELQHRVRSGGVWAAWRRLIDIPSAANALTYLRRNSDNTEWEDVLATQVQQDIGGWEQIAVANPTASLNIYFLNLGAFRTLRMTCGLLPAPAATTVIGMQVSSDNGVTWLTTADYTHTGYYITPTGLQTQPGSVANYIELAAAATSQIIDTSQTILTEFNKPLRSNARLIKAGLNGTDRYIVDWGVEISGNTEWNALRVTAAQNLAGQIILEGVRG